MISYVVIYPINGNKIKKSLHDNDMQGFKIISS